MFTGIFILRKVFDKKCQRQGLRSQKGRNLTCVNEHFSDERNAVFGIFLQRR